MTIVNNHGEKVKIDKAEDLIIGEGRDNFSLAVFSQLVEGMFVELCRYPNKEKAKTEVSKIKECLDNGIICYFVDRN